MVSSILKDYFFYFELSTSKRGSTHTSATADPSTQVIRPATRWEFPPPMRLLG
jgi:hypothetical protein